MSHLFINSNQIIWMKYFTGVIEVLHACLPTGLHLPVCITGRGFFLSYLIAFMHTRGYSCS